MLNVGFFIFDQMELLDFAGPYEVFAVTSELNDDGLFKLFSVSGDGKAIQTVNGLKVLPDYGFGEHPAIDLLVVPGGVGTRDEMNKPAVLEWLSGAQRQARYTMSVCSGARLLGKMGLLDGVEATTHHEVLPHLREIAPQAIIRPEARFIDNGAILTSAGISAGIDLALYLVEKLHGAEIARKTRIYMEYGNWEELV
ncbi:DJ-1/PfpI family protein [Hydrogenispora ethanolica]|uniref:DJ-1/PfpI family protein n=1 Tax=Hydrogenispora ethanolica TaxID=1082276 RepID=A0A4R1S076_HYDET|nr:DJ-1/PfpI family protein [Hydrogenispora ethanolica]TCL72309.1 DJ-1/PfpI family protein [Hydrogenispora ethanolica]